MSRVYVIAEAGVNHDGSVEMAAGLVRAAAKAGADAVKFQAFSADALASAGAPKAAYQKASTDADESQLEMLRTLEFGEQAHRAMQALCAEEGIDFLSSAFDMGSLEWLLALGLPMLKIPSGEITNLPYLRVVGAQGSKVLLSTGMADLGEVAAALEVLADAGTPRGRVVVLHCSTEYPAPFEDVNLRAMVTMREKLGVRIGYSDHTLGITVPVAAVALGAEVIEKHLTLDRDRPGPDHSASLEPDEFTAMVRAIRETEAALGSTVKEPTGAGVANRDIVRKSIVASRPIAAGDVLTAENLTVKRPGTGISPMLWDELVGTRATRAYAPDEQVTP